LPVCGASALSCSTPRATASAKFTFNVTLQSKACGCLRSFILSSNAGTLASYNETYKAEFDQTMYSSFQKLSTPKKQGIFHDVFLAKKRSRMHIYNRFIIEF